MGRARDEALYGNIRKIKRCGPNPPIPQSLLRTIFLFQKSENLWPEKLENWHVSCTISVPEMGVLVSGFGYE